MSNWMIQSSVVVEFNVIKNELEHIAGVLR